jgi:pimeloyl-ACP methyl ester carboxylesterase
MNNDVLRTFLAASIEEQARMTLDVQYMDVLKAYLGEAAYSEYAAIAQDIRDARSAVRGLRTPKNLLLVPGIMGSLLSSRTLGGVWWVDIARGWDKLDKLGLQPDGQTDIDPAQDIYPFAIDMLYAPFQCAVLQRDDFGHDVFPFDWRKPLSYSTAQMRAKINELYNGNGHQPVHIVAHSMGSLMTRATLVEYGDELWPKLGRIIFAGGAHYGATLAACRLKFHLWDLDAQSVCLALLIRPETFRSLWGAVSLIPAPVGIYPGTRSNQGSVASHPCVDFDLYKIEAWGLDVDSGAASRLQRILDYAAHFYKKLYDYHFSLDQEHRDRIAVIAGVGYATAFRLTLNNGPLGARRDNRREPGNHHRESDGTVPLASADLENVGATRYVKHIHATLLNHPDVSADVFHWLNEEPMKLPTTPQIALEQHQGETNESLGYPNLTALVRGRVQAEENLPEIVEPTPELVASLRAQIETGRFPSELNLARLF